MKIVNSGAMKILPMPQSAPDGREETAIILKGTFELRSGGACTLAAEQDEIADDRTFMDGIGRSLVWASDLAPAKPRTDFYILGSFHQPGGVPAPSGEAVFRFGPIEKRLVFHGPRFARRRPEGGWSIGAAVPVRSVPLRWEFSYGGLDDPRNPMGLGQDPTTGPDGIEVIPLPQIEDPRDPLRGPKHRPRPANFAPVPPGFAERLDKRGTYDRRWQVFRAPLPPEDFDPSLHNAAPEDQQAGDFPRGDEALVLRNLHPKIPELATRLPGLRPRIGILRLAGGQIVAEEVAMNLDTIVAMPDRDRLVLVWRSAAAVPVDPIEDDVPWLQVEVEPLAGQPEPFAAIAQRMVDRYRQEQPVEEDADVALAVTMAEVRDLLKEAELPAELRRIVDTETDPDVVAKALMAHVDTVIADLSRAYPQHFPPEVPE